MHLNHMLTFFSFYARFLCLKPFVIIVILILNTSLWVYAQCPTEVRLITNGDEVSQPLNNGFSKLICDNADDLEVELEILLNGAQGYTIDWGDGNTQSFNATAPKTSLSHVYAAEGDYAFSLSAGASVGAICLSGNIKIVVRSFISPQYNNVINDFACPDGGNQFQLDLTLNHPRLSPNDEYTINWGDGATTLLKSSDFDAQLGTTDFNHTYNGAFPGDSYIVTITGVNSFLNSCAPVILPANQTIIFQEEPEPDFTVSGNVCENGGMVTVERTTKFDFPTSEGSYQWEIINVTDGITIFTFPFDEISTSEADFSGNKENFEFFIEDGDIDFADELVVKLVERNSCTPGIVKQENVQINLAPATTINTINGSSPAGAPLELCLQDLEIVLNGYDPDFTYAWTLANGHNLAQPPSSINNDVTMHPFTIPANQLTTGNRTLFIKVNSKSCEKILSVEVVIREDVDPALIIDNDLDGDGVADDNCGARSFDMSISDAGLANGDEISFLFSKTANFSNIEAAETVVQTFDGTLDVVNKTLSYFGTADEAIWYVRSQVKLKEGCEYTSSIEPIVIKEPTEELGFFVQLVNGNSPTDKQKNFIFCDGDRVSVQVSGAASSNSVFNWKTPAGATLDDNTPNNRALVFVVSEATDGAILEVEEVLNGCSFTSTSDPVSVSTLPDKINVFVTSTGTDNGSICNNGNSSVTFEIPDAIGEISVEFNVNGNIGTISGTSPLIYGDDPGETLLQNLTSDANIFVVSALTESGCTIADLGTSVSINVVDPIYNLGLNNNTACANDIIELKVEVNQGSGPYDLTISNDKGLPDITLTGYTSGSTIPLSVPNTAQDIVYQVSGIQDVATGCSPVAGTAPTATLSVLAIPPLPAISTTHPNPVCSGTEVTLTSDLVLNNATYRWIDKSGGIIQENASPDLKLNNVQDEEYQVKVVSAGGCASDFSDPKPVNIVALPAKPEISVTDGVAEFCDDNNTSVSLAVTDVKNDETYQWFKDDNEISMTTAGILLNDISESGDYKVQVIGPGTTACESAISDPVMVTIKEIPEAPVLSGETNVCAGPGKEFYFVAPKTGATYNWSVPAAANQVLGGAPEDPFVQLVFPDAGNYSLDVALTINGCTGPLTDLKVEVLNPTTTSAIAGKDKVCEGDLETYSVTSTAGSTYQWTVPSGSFITTGGNSNQVTVSFGSGTAAGPDAKISVTETNVAGCESKIVIKNVTVNNLPAAKIIGTSATICEGDEFDLEVEWSGALPLTVNYLVDGITTGDFTIPAGTTGNYFHNFDPDPSETTIYTLTSVTDDNGCGSSATGLVRVNVDPVPELELGANQSIPEGSNLTIIPETLSGTYSSIEWSSSPASAGSFDNVNSENPTFTPNPGFTGAITITATISDPGPCSEVNDSFILNVNPAGAIIAGNDLTVCENTSNISLLDAARDTENKYDQYTWSAVPAGTFSKTIINNPDSDDDLHTIFTPTSGKGTYTITLSALDYDDGLPNTSESFILIINELPAATLITNNDQIICAGESAEISVQLTGNSSDPQWTLVWENDLGATGTITADASPFTFDVPGTSGDTRTYQIRSVSENDGAVCTNNTIPGSVNVVSRPLPTAEILTNNYEVCDGAPMEITIEMTGNGPWNVKWSADGGATENTIASIISSPHTFSVNPPAGSTTNFVLTEVTEQNGTLCTGTIVGDGVTITNNPLPTAILSGNATICEGQSTDLTFDFTGTAPWNVTYNNGTADITIDDIAASPFTETVTPAGNTTYTQVEVSDGNGCARDGLTQSVVVQVNPIPTVDAGPDRSVPVNTVINLVPDLSGSYTSVQWDDGGSGGTFANAATANTSYTPPAGFVGDITLTLTLGDGAGPCADDISDQLVVTYNAAGSVVAGPNQEVCDGGTVTLAGAGLAADYERYLWSADRPGTFSPASIDNPATADDLHTDFFPSNGPGSYLVTLTVVDLDGVLPDATGNLTVIVNPLPMASIAGAATICEGQSTDLTFDFTGTAPWNVTYNNGTADITIDDIAASPFTETVTPAGNTTYTQVEVSDGNGCARDGLTQSVVVQVNPLVQVNPQITSDLCSGEIIRIEGNPLGGSGIYDTHLWQGSGAAFLNSTAIPNPEFQVDVDQPTTYELIYEVTDRNTCVTTSEILNFTVNPKPEINFAEKQLEICAGEVLRLNPEVTGGDGNYNHQWTGNGSVWLSAADVEQPEFSAVVDRTTNFNLTYSLKDGNSCQVTDQLKINVLPAIVIEPIEDKALCQLEKILLSANVSGDYSSLQWSSDQAGTFDSPEELNTFFTPGDDITGEVEVLITATSQGAVCSESNSSFIIEVKERINLEAGENLTACENEPAQLEADVSGNYSSLQWSTIGAGNLSSQINPQTTYQPADEEIGVVTFNIVASDDSGLCPTVQDEVTINFNPAPEFDLQADDLWCEDDLVLIEGTVSGTFTDLNWTTSGNGVFSNSNTASTTYIPADNEVGEVVLTLNSQDASGSCPEFSAAVNINIVPKPMVDAGGNQTINEGETANLQANVSGTYDRLQWTTSGNGTFSGNNVSATYTPGEGEEGEIILTLTALDDSNLCGSVSDQLILTIIPRVPTARFAVSTNAGCVPLEVDFSNQSFDATSYEWDFGDNSNQVFSRDAGHIYNIPGTYTATLTAQNAAGRQDQFSVSIQVYSLPVASFSVDPLEYFMPDPINIVNVSQGASAYLWNFGDGNTSTEFEPVYVYSVPGAYEVSLLVENEVGCANEFFLPEPVVIKEGGTIVIPTAFTPSVAGPAEGRVLDVNANDVFLPVTTGVQDFQMVIFNRWGQQVFESNDADIGWNGFIGTELAPSGAYVYQVKIQFSDGKFINKTGSVTLIR